MGFKVAAGTHVAVPERPNLSPGPSPEQDLVTPAPAVRHDSGSGARLVGGDEAPHRLWTDIRLIHQGNDRSLTSARNRCQSSAQRGTHPGSPIGVLHDRRLSDDERNRAGDDDDRIASAALQQPDCTVDKPLAVQYDQRLRPAEAPPGAGGEHHTGDRISGSTGRGDHRPGPWILPSVSESRRPVAPHCSATISAATETAVSSGVRAPMSRPIGDASRSSSESDRPAARNRASRSSWVRREPIAPTYAAGVRSATSSNGTSNFGSWVSTQMTERASTGVRERYRCGHSTITSSASGNRAFVAKIGRASQTVTR